MQKKNVKTYQTASQSKKFAAGSEQPLHIMISSPLYLRKSVLSCALDITKMLKTYAELKQIREAKLTLIDSFRTVHSEIRKTLRDLEKENLPKFSVKEHTEERHEESRDFEPSERKQMVVEEVVSNSEIDMLKEELAQIEKKLSQL